MSWTCDQIEAQISDYLDGAMTVAQEAAFTVHLAGCSDCANLLWRVKGARKHMRNIRQVEVPPRLISSILDSTIGLRLTPWQIFTKWFRGPSALKFGYVAGSVITTCLIVLNASGVPLRKVKLSDLSPGAVYRNVDPVRGGQIECSVPGVRANGHSTYVPGFGKAYFAESLISHGTRTLTMLRFELGSTTGGSGSGGGGSTNGKHYPPG